MKNSLAFIAVLLFGISFLFADGEAPSIGDLPGTVMSPKEGNTLQDGAAARTQPCEADWLYTEGESPYEVTWIIKKVKAPAGLTFRAFRADEIVVPRVIQALFARSGGPQAIWKFWRNYSLMVDIWYDPASAVSWGIVPSTFENTTLAASGTEIVIAGVIAEPPHAAKFPLKADGNFTVAGKGGNELHWSARVTDIDIDIDSDNDNGFDAPDQSVNEEKIEEAKAKYLKVNDSDVDNDEIPDFADWEISPSSQALEQNENAGKFIPVKVDLGMGMNENTRIFFEYAASDPSQVKKTNDDTYELPSSGHLRLWTKDGRESRTDKDLNKGGDFVASSMGYTYTQLGFEGPTTTLYLEAVKPTSENATQDDLFIVVRDAENFAKDKVKVRAVKVEYVIPDESYYSLTRDYDAPRVVAEFVGTSDPNPVIELDDVTDASVSIGVNTATLNISGMVKDAVADNFPRGAGVDIATISASLNGDTMTKDLNQEEGEDKGFWRQHPYQGTFEDLQISIPLEAGMHTVKVETSKNVCGNTGFEEIKVLLSKQCTGGGGIHYTNIYFDKEGLAPNRRDTVRLYAGPAKPIPKDWLLTEKGINEGPAFVFYASIERYGRFADAVLTVTEINGKSIPDDGSITWDTDVRETIGADITYIYSNGDVEHFDNRIYLETTSDSRIFQVADPFGGYTETWTAKVQKGLKSSPGSYTPCAIRIKGLGGEDINDYRLEVEDFEFELEEGPEGEENIYYIKGKSRYITTLRIKKDEDEIEAFLWDIESGDEPKWVELTRVDTTDGTAVGVTTLIKHNDKIYSWPVNSVGIIMESLHRHEGQTTSMDPKATTLFVYDARRIHLWAVCRVIPSLKKQAAAKLFGDNLRFQVSEIDDSHGAQQRVKLSWKNPASDDAKKGAVSFFSAKNSYNESTGQFLSKCYFYGLPEDNDDFGYKQVSLSFKKNEIAEARFKLFFKPRKNDHPNLKEVDDNTKTAANWYYYWSQQRKGKGDGTCMYHYGKVGDNEYLVKYKAVHGNRNGAYSITPGSSRTPEITMYNKAAEGEKASKPSVPVKLKSAGEEKNEVQAFWSLKTGPESANKTFAHELTHHLVFEENSSGDDEVPDQWEELIGLDPDLPNTFKAFNGSKNGDFSRDHEFYAWVGACFQKGFTKRKSKDPDNDYYLNGTKLGDESYQGRVPDVPNNDENWSYQGCNWKEIE